MTAQFDRYRPELFAQLLAAATPQSPQSLQSQRTSHTRDRLFRDFKRRCRQQTGQNALGQTLRTLLANIPLVKNRHHEADLQILLNGHTTLAELFAAIDPDTVRPERRQASKIRKNSNPTEFRFHTQMRRPRWKTRRRQPAVTPPASTGRFPP